MLNITIGLLCLMLSNICLGASLQTLKNNFNLNSFIKGILKVIFIGIGLALTYYAGYLNPTILAVNINGVNMNLMEGIKTIFILGIIFYGYQSLDKIAGILKIKVVINQGNNTSEEENEDETTIPR